MPDSSVLVWFREDLRLADNPALRSAAASGEPVVALFVLDEVSPGVRPYGGAQRWWLHHALASLSDGLSALGVTLVLRRGPAAEVVPTVAREVRAGRVVANRRYEPAEVAVDDSVARALRAGGAVLETFAARLLYEPDEVRGKTGDPIKVFTPFWRAARATRPVRDAVPAVTKPLTAGPAVPSDALDDWGLLPAKPDWAGGLREAWRPGEAGAAAVLERFLRDGLPGYADGRNRPDKPSTSRLSPYLRFGDISVIQVWHAAEAAVRERRTAATAEDLTKFHAELGWRDFAYHLLGQFPDLATRNFQPRFDAFPWVRNDAFLHAWQRGRTGYPIVDAGMRQLWQTGWMHNRVRMIVGSFLVKHLRIDWREGERWFWDTLVDADPANNPASWQWVAGTGADAAPYFRVFNPILQGLKFDPEGDYVRRYVPELAGLPPDAIHAPWDVPTLVLRSGGVTLGETYPHPIVEHDRARQQALDAFQRIKDAA